MTRLNTSLPPLDRNGHGVNIQLQRPEIEFLEKRGARPHRGGSDFCRSSVLTRQLTALEALLEVADPRPLLPPPVYAAAVNLLHRLRDGCWRLKPLEIEQLEKVISSSKPRSSSPPYSSLLIRSRSSQEPSGGTAVAAINGVAIR